MGGVTDITASRLCEFDIGDSNCRCDADGIRCDLSDSNSNRYNAPNAGCRTDLQADLVSYARS